MELLPTMHDDGIPNNIFQKVDVTCKYTAAEPLTIKFFYNGQESPPKLYTESILDTNGWHGEHHWSTFRDTRKTEQLLICKTITQKNTIVGTLYANLSPGTF